jgi:hypothetical protein
MQSFNMKGSEFLTFKTFAYLTISIDLFIEVSEILNLLCYGFAFWVRYWGITVIQGSEILNPPRLRINAVISIYNMQSQYLFNL